MARRPKFEDKNPALAARNLASEIDLLRSFGLSSSRIAALFDDTPANIRKINSRFQFPNELPVSEVAIPVRSEFKEEFPIYGSKRQQLEEREWQIEQIFQQHASKFQFHEGARILKELAGALSAPTHPRRIRMLARVHHHIAWFAVQQGHCRSAIFHGERAMNLSRIAYRYSWDKTDLARYVESALVISMAVHLSSEDGTARRELYSLSVLDVARSASEVLRDSRGSEHHRQRGSAFLFLGRDDEARKEFELAMEAMRKNGEAIDENHVQMTGGRFLNLLGKHPDWDNAQELLAKVRQTFGKNSLQHAININCTAAAGLLTGSPHIEQQAISLLKLNASLAGDFGRQATVTKLLSITSELGLSPDQRSRWIRQALRANALRKL